MKRLFSKVSLIWVVVFFIFSSCKNDEEDQRIIGCCFHQHYPTEVDCSSNWSYFSSRPTGTYSDNKLDAPVIQTNGKSGYIVLDFTDTKVFWGNPADGIDIMDTYGFYQYPFYLFEDEMTPEEYRESYKYYRVPEELNRTLSCGLEITLKKKQKDGVSFYRMEIRADEIKEEFKGNEITVRTETTEYYSKVKISL